jgi:hypothetical protein
VNALALLQDKRDWGTGIGNREEGIVEKGKEKADEEKREDGAPTKLAKRAETGEGRGAGRPPVPA